MDKSSLLLFTLIALVQLGTALSERPIFFFHGLGDSCTRYNSLKIPKQFICVESGSTVQSFLSLNYQITNICKNFRTTIERVKFQYPFISETGFYLMGFEQGGLLARSVLHLCAHVKDKVKGIITIGTPNLGVDDHRLLHKSPSTNIIEDFFNNLVTKTFNSLNDRLSSNPVFAPFQYLNRFEEVSLKEHDRAIYIDDENKHNSELYLNFGGEALDTNKGKGIVKKLPSKFIEELNGMPNAASDHDGLSIFLNFMLLEDLETIPLPTQTFGAIYDSLDTKVKSFRKTQAYKEDYMGLKSLYDQGKLINCALNCGAYNISESIFERLAEVLSSSNCSRFEDNTKLTRDQMYTLCVHYNFRKDDFRELYKCDNRFLVISEVEKQAKAKTLFGNVPNFKKATYVSKAGLVNWHDAYRGMNGHKKKTYKAVL